MLIGFHGPSQSGKDTCFRILQELVKEHRPALEVVRIASADVVKDSICGTFNHQLTRQDIENFKNHPAAVVSLHLPGKPMVTMSLRQYMSNFCNQGHRDIFGEDFWIDQSVPPNFDHSGSLYVVTDVRFDNEVDRIEYVGGTVYHLYGSPVEGKTDDRAEQRLQRGMPTIYNDVRNDNFESLRRQLNIVLQHQLVTNSD